MSLPPEPYSSKAKGDGSKPAFWRNSFLRMTTTDQRNSPEELLRDLYRELFFEKPNGGRTGKEKKKDYNSIEKLREEKDQDEKLIEEKHIATLLAFRGRKKTSGMFKGTPYFAHPYPWYAQFFWERKEAASGLKNLFLSGALAQHAVQTPNKKDQFTKDIPKIVDALLGNEKELFACGIDNTLGNLTKEEAIQRLEKCVESGNNGMYSRKCGTKGDKLGSRIYNDFISLCELEGQIPRYNWIQLLMGFLSIATSSWLLAQMRLTRYMRDWLFEALDEQKTPRAQDVEKTFNDRYKTIFEASINPTRDLYNELEEYGRARVNLLVIFKELSEPLSIENEKKGLSGDSTEIESFLNKCKKNAKKFKSELGITESFEDFTISKSMEYRLFNDPRYDNGIVNNLEEYLTVLRNPKSSGINESYLIETKRPKGAGTTETWTRIAPGPMTLQLFVYLSSQKKIKEQKRGRVTLKDLMNHFGFYGVQFAENDEGTDFLKNELHNAGMLKGSPDAGAHAQLEDSLTSTLNKKK